MTRRPSDFQLEQAILSPGFTPRSSDAGLLLELLASEEPTARHAERALAQLGVSGAALARDRFTTANGRLRARLCRLVARIARETADPASTAFLVERANDPDPATRRAAFVGLGKLETGTALEALLTAWDRGPELVELRALAAALGKLGDARALQRLGRLPHHDAELERIAGEARLKIERTLLRAEPGEIVAAGKLPRECRVRLLCRRGLELILCEEVGPALEPKVGAPGTVDVKFAGALTELWKARTALRFGFPLSVSSAASAERAAIDALTSTATLELLSALTRGPIRYRLEWAGSGHRRASSFEVARAVSLAEPSLINDPRRPLWELVISETPRGIDLEIWPRGLDDPRFIYRRKLVPAASHPTLAAALARIAGVRPRDVIWDPFVGAGTELIERARLGPHKKLYGSDLDPAALAAARENLRFANIDAELVRGDARHYRPPEPVSLVLTNPPMGRRVRSHEGLHELFTVFLQHAAELLAVGGRLVWISPLPPFTLSAARRAGLTVELRQRVDMGGFTAEIQRFAKTTRQGVR